MKNILSKLFNGNSTVKTEVPFSADELSETTSFNRDSLGQIPDWIDEEAFRKSCFQYGVPDFIRPVINKKIGNATTYTDLMTFAGHKFFGSMNYLEIGVSVGKNFFQMLNAFSAARYTGFDIEEINPVLERKLQFTGRNEWDTPAKSIKKSNSSLSSYTYNNNKVDYLCADVWDQNSWSKLEGNKYNLVFSDALHSPEAILFEFEMLVKYQLLDEKFVIVWDDLVGKMKNSFFKIIRRYNDRFGIRDTYLVNVNGWIGEHEGPHSVGLISNFPFA